ncbi:MAG: ATP-binding protein, partial [Acidobacteriota bacterium]|nr:ATP-binding protein [Acidobacteriota bacterium]
EQNLQCLESIASEATRCGAIVSQLLAFARQRGGRFTAMRINDVVEKAVFLLQHQLDMNGVTVRRELAPDLPVIVADPDQVQQASMALLINASQALEGGGTVTLRTRSEEAWVVLEVADDGPGMPPEVAERVFEPFFTTREEDGGARPRAVGGLRHSRAARGQRQPADGAR